MLPPAILWLLFRRDVEERCCYYNITHPTSTASTAIIVANCYSLAATRVFEYYWASNTISTLGIFEVTSAAVGYANREVNSGSVFLFAQSLLVSVRTVANILCRRSLRQEQTLFVASWGDSVLSNGYADRMVPLATSLYECNMYVALTVPAIDKRRSEPVAAPELHQNLTVCTSAPHHLFREFCSEDATVGIPTPRSSPSRSGILSASASPKRSASSASVVPPRRCSTAIADRRISAAPSCFVIGGVIGSAAGGSSGSRQRRADDDFDGWLEFYQKRVPPPRKSSLSCLSPNAGGYRCRSFSITPKGSVLNLGEVLLGDPSRRRSTGSCNDRSDIQLLT